jgi:hypothetical protein
MKVKVTLADAPTDVLVYLSQQDDATSVSARGIAEDIAPEDADTPLLSVSSALTLLQAMGAVEPRPWGNTKLWKITDEGRQMIAESVTP